MFNIGGMTGVTRGTHGWLLHAEHKSLLHEIVVHENGKKKSSGSAWRNVFYTDSIGAMLGIGWNEMKLLFSYVIDS